MLAAVFGGYLVAALARVALTLWLPVRRAEAGSQEKMSANTAGMPLPPGMKLPF